MTLPQILICDDDSTFHLAVKYSLKGRVECRSAYHSEEAIAILKNQAIDIVLMDIQMRTSDEGLRCIPRLKEIDEDVSIIMSTGLSDIQSIREAMRLGASDYVPKDFDSLELNHAIQLALERRHLLRRRAQQNFEAASSQKKHVLVGSSPAIVQLRRTIEKVRESNANVLITGETGTGKEVVARLLRKTLPDGSLEPFVAVDSSTIQGTMAESILFGYEKGAFTGAEKTTKGIFEEANGGIVYFDELGNMPLEIQAKLLRVVQEKEVVRLGSSKVIKLDFRVICATNRDLEKMSSEGQFKYDLLQRINVLPMHLAPLRDRLSDIPDLCSHFLSSVSYGKTSLRMTQDALDALMAYSWPGNVRELSNIISYLAAMVDGSEVDFADLPPKLRDARQVAAITQCTQGQTPPSEGKGFYEQVSAFEKALLEEGYRSAGGNISRLAVRFAMDRSHLYTKLREHKIHPTKSS